MFFRVSIIFDHIIIIGRVQTGKGLIGHPKSQYITIASYHQNISPPHKILKSSCPGGILTDELNVGFLGTTKKKTKRSPENLCGKLEKLEPCVGQVALPQFCLLDAIRGAIFLFHAALPFPCFSIPRYFS